MLTKQQNSWRCKSNSDLMLFLVNTIATMNTKAFMFTYIAKYQKNSSTVDCFQEAFDGI